MEFEAQEETENRRDTLARGLSARIRKMKREPGMLEKLWRFLRGRDQDERKKGTVSEVTTVDSVETLSNASVPSEQDVKSVSLEIVERKEVLSPIRIATYRDLLKVDPNRPLPAEAEYPPLPRKVKALSVDEIMAIYAGPIRQAADDLPMSEEEIDAYFMPVIRRALSYMHLLPASQFNHHNGIGGLFAHSLQVAGTAVQIGKRKVFNRRDTPRQLYNNGKRWLFGCWLSGFLHDIGKPATDVIVTAEGETWYANAENLTEWLALNNKSEYSFVWQSGGHRKHQQSTLFFVREIVSPDTFAWLAAFGSRDIWEACETALTTPDYTGPNGLVAEVVREADEIVSGDDIRERNAGIIDSRRMGGGLPAADFILDAIRLMLSEKTMEVNARRSFLFVTTVGSFLIWSTSTVERIYARVLEDKHTSVPKQIDRMLDCLVGGGVLEPAPQEISPASRYYWPLIVDLYPSKVFRAVKLRSNFSIFNGMVAPEPCLAIINGFSGNPPEILEAWEAKHGKLLTDQAVVKNTADIPVCALSTDAPEDNDALTAENDLSEAAYAEYARENPNKTGSEAEKVDDEPQANLQVHQAEEGAAFKTALLQCLQVPMDSNVKNEKESNEEMGQELQADLSHRPSVQVKSPSREDHSGLERTILDACECSFLSPPVDDEPMTHLTEEAEHPRVLPEVRTSLVSSLSESGSRELIPVMVSESSENPPPLKIKTVIVSRPSDAEAPSFPEEDQTEATGTGAEDTTDVDRDAESEDDELSASDAVIDEEIYKTTQTERGKAYGSKEIAQKRAKAVKTMAAKADADTEQHAVKIAGGGIVLMTNDGDVRPIALSAEAGTSVSPPSSKTSFEAAEEGSMPSSEGSSGVSSDPRSWSVTKKLAYLREEAIQGLLTDSRLWFPDGVVRVSDTEYRGVAEKIFERGAELGLDRVKVKKLQTGFQPDSWKISFSEEARGLVISIRKK